MKCVNCKKEVIATTYYSQTANFGPLYFVAKIVKGPEYFYTDIDLPLCNANCATEYRYKQNILEV